MQPNALVSVSAPLPAATRQLWIGRLARNRRVLAGAFLGVVAVAAASQWSWLVAVGAAPLLLSVAPCVAMCGLGLCMSRMGGGRSCAAAPENLKTVDGSPQGSSQAVEI